jgi:hypothetical protein
LQVENALRPQKAVNEEQRVRIRVDDKEAEDENENDDDGLLTQKVYAVRKR